MKRYKLYESGGYFYIRKLTKIYHRAWAYITVDRKFTTFEDANKYIDELEKERLKTIQENRKTQ